MLTCLCFFKHEPSFAQDTKDATVRDCKSTVLEFYKHAKAKDYKSAYRPWIVSFKNCPKSSRMIYKYGLKIIGDRYQKASGNQKELESAFIDSIYAQRVQYFPENLGKVYSDWATSLEKRDASKAEVFEKLEMAFQVDPSQMSIKNIAKYFQQIKDANKDLDVQEIFDTYDTALEAVNKKIEIHSKSLDVLNAKKARGELFSKKDSLMFKNNGINLRGLGQIEGILDMILHRGTTVSCERLLRLYKKGLDKHSTDVKWLRRAVSRLNSKECGDEAIFSKLVEAYWKVDPSLDAYIRGCRILDEDQVRNVRKVKPSIEDEKDPYKRAEYFYRIAYGLKHTNKSQSLSYAYKALKERPSLGKAYLLIARLYASSANACGTDEFSKRMVFIAAANKAEKAKEVDPSMTSRANKYIKSYLANAPSKWRIIHFTSKEFQINCWIGETVKIP